MSYWLSDVSTHRASLAKSSSRNQGAEAQKLCSAYVMSSFPGKRRWCSDEIVLRRLPIEGVRDECFFKGKSLRC